MRKPKNSIWIFLVYFSIVSELFFEIIVNNITIITETIIRRPVIKQLFLKYFFRTFSFTLGISQVPLKYFSNGVIHKCFSTLFLKYFWYISEGKESPKSIPYFLVFLNNFRELFFKWFSSNFFQLRSPDIIKFYF